MGRPQPSLDDCVRVLLVTLAGSRGRCGPLGSVSGRVLLGGFGWWVTGSQVGGEAFGPLFFAAEKRGRGAKRNQQLAIGGVAKPCFSLCFTRNPVA